MRTFLGAVLLLALASPAAAQYEPTFPGCQKCGVIGYVDIPSTATTVSNADLLTHAAAIEGWGFECVSGNPVDRIDLFVEDDHRPDVWRPLAAATFDGSVTLTQGGYYARPDVEDAFVASCPAILGRPTGFIRWIDKPLPIGAHRFLIVLWRGPYHSQTQGPNALIKTLNVVQ